MNFGKIAILGNGISAGLLAYLLSPKNKITVLKGKNHMFSPIPEILPRDTFFNALGMNHHEQNKVIENTKSHLTDFILNRNNAENKISICSNDKYYIYDKEKLADYLISNSNVEDIQFQNIEDVKSLENYDLIFDCRGKRSIMDDPSYHTRIIFPARTKCSYIIAECPEASIESTMTFWTDSNKYLKYKKTFFTIPLKNHKMSIGCSYNPNHFIHHQDLLEMASGHGIKIFEDQIFTSGEALPNILKSSTNLKNVIPIGESSESSCPLTEYGVLKSLNQIYKVLGNQFSPISIKRHFNNSEIDPHIPMELCA